MLIGLATAGVADSGVGLKTKAVCGRALRGERLVSSVPRGHWKTTTVIAALGLEGIGCALNVDGV